MRQESGRLESLARDTWMAQMARMAEHMGPISYDIDVLRDVNFKWMIHLGPFIQEDVVVTLFSNLCLCLHLLGRELCVNCFSHEVTSTAEVPRQWGPRRLRSRSMWPAWPNEAELFFSGRSDLKGEEKTQKGILVFFFFLICPFIYQKSVLEKYHKFENWKTYRISLVPFFLSQ